MRAVGTGSRVALAAVITSVTACSVVFSLDGYAGKTRPEAGIEGGGDASDAGIEAALEASPPADADADAIDDVTLDTLDSSVDAGPDCGGPTPLLVAYWKIDEGEGGVVHDFSGSGILGVINGATWGAGPEAGAVALHFNSNSNQFVDFGDPIPLQLMGAMTITAHVDSTFFVDGGNDQPIVSKRGENDRGWELYLQDHGIVFDVATDQSDYQPPLYAGFVPLNEWHRVAVVYDPSVAALYAYLDGVLVGSQIEGGVPTAQHDSVNHVHLGSAGDCNVTDGAPCQNGQGFNGAVAEVRVYASALNQCQIQAIP
jgi:hypothetical protein